MMLYFTVGILAPIILNLMHLVLGVYIVVQRGNIYSLGFTGVAFLTKALGMLFLTWFGVSYLALDYRIFVPLLTFFWFFSHLVEAFVIQHHMGENTPQWLQNLQIK